MALFEVVLKGMDQRIYVAATGYRFDDSDYMNALGATGQNRNRHRVVIFDDYAGLDVRYVYDRSAPGVDSFEFGQWRYWLPAASIQAIRQVEDNAGAWAVTYNGSGPATGAAPVESNNNLFVFLLKYTAGDYDTTTTKTAEGQAGDADGRVNFDYMFLLGDSVQLANATLLKGFQKIANWNPQGATPVVKLVNYRGRGSVDQINNPPFVNVLPAVIAANKKVFTDPEDDLHLPLKQVAGWFQVQHFLEDD